MNLVASMMARNEMGRFLPQCVESLLTFCDEVRVLDDGSTDGTLEWLEAHDQVAVTANTGEAMFEHEGKARNLLLDWTLRGRPSHVLAIDADEFVGDGAALREACSDRRSTVWSLNIEEVWKADASAMWVRQDGGWRPHAIPVLYQAPRHGGGLWRIQDRQLACGREPLAVRRIARLATPTGVSLLHMGWTNVADRAARYARYVEADGGKFHASQHLRSIMWGDRQVRLARREWPAGLERWKYDLTVRVAA